jgi:hypothetical protein
MESPVASPRVPNHRSWSHRPLPPESPPAAPVLCSVYEESRMGSRAHHRGSRCASPFKQYGVEVATACLGGRGLHGAASNFLLVAAASMAEPPAESMKLGFVSMARVDSFAASGQFPWQRWRATPRHQWRSSCLCGGLQLVIVEMTRQGRSDAACVRLALGLGGEGVSAKLHRAVWGR